LLVADAELGELLDGPEAGVALAQEFGESYPAAVNLLVDLFQRMAQCDGECSRVNSAAPDRENRRLRAVELHARGMTAFSRDQPPLIESVHLFDFVNSSRRWPPQQPPLDPGLFVPVQVGDPRLTTDRWWEVGQEQRAADEARQKRETIEADRARREFYGQRT
jgi:hypothetical protein